MSDEKETPKSPTTRLFWVHPVLDGDTLAPVYAYGYKLTKTKGGYYADVPNRSVKAELNRKLGRKFCTRSTFEAVNKEAETEED